MPMTPRCQPSPPTTSTLCAPTAGSVSIAFFALHDQVRLLLLAAEVLVIELLGQRPRLVTHGLVGRQQQPRRDVGRAHAPRGVDARREDEADLVAVDRLARQARRLEQRAQSDGVRSAAERGEPEPRDDAVLADERHDVGQRADRGNLDEGRQPLALSRRARTAPARASARRRRRRGSCPDTCSRDASG